MQNVLNFFHDYDVEFFFKRQIWKTPFHSFLFENSLNKFSFGTIVQKEDF